MYRTVAQGGTRSGWYLGARFSLCSDESRIGPPMERSVASRGTGPRHCCKPPALTGPTVERWGGASRSVRKEAACRSRGPSRPASAPGTTRDAPSTEHPLVRSRFHCRGNGNESSASRSSRLSKRASERASVCIGRSLHPTLDQPASPLPALSEDGNCCALREFGNGFTCERRSITDLCPRDVTIPRPPPCPRFD